MQPGSKGGDRSTVHRAVIRRNFQPDMRLRENANANVRLCGKIFNAAHHPVKEEHASV
jgi:hypothetical protein